MQVLRTPDERFAAVPDFPYPPHYADLDVAVQRDGHTDRLRVAYLDEGPRDGPLVVALHGEPTWSFLYRLVIPPLTAAGLRVVAPDLVGFGRSDKPTEVADHSYSAHVGWMRALLIDVLDLHDITLLCHDWGGLIGLRVLAEAPDRFARVVATNTGLPDGNYRLPETWWRFRDFVASTPELPVGMLVQAGCATALPPEVIAAYDAPFPSPAYLAGPRAMPDLIPQSPDHPETPHQARAWAVLGAFDRPFLTAFTDSDAITAGVDEPLQALIPGAAGQPHTRLAGGRHFVQEDCGPELAQVVVDFVAGR